MTEWETPRAAGEPTLGPSQLHDAERRAAREVAETSRHLERLPPAPPTGPEEAEKDCGVVPCLNVPVWPHPRRRRAVEGEMCSTAEMAQMEESMEELTRIPTGMGNARLPLRGRVGGVGLEPAHCDGGRTSEMETSTTRPLRQDQAHPQRRMNKAAGPAGQPKERAPRAPDDPAGAPGKQKAPAGGAAPTRGGGSELQYPENSKETAAHEAALELTAPPYLGPPTPRVAGSREGEMETEQARPRRACQAE